MRAVASRFAPVGACLLLGLTGCGSCAAPPEPTPPVQPPEPAEPPVPAEPPEPPDPLAVDLEQTDFNRNPALLRRLRASPHSYFRFIHRQFSTAVCEELGDSMIDAPPVNLHGDAHLEQYAVTDLGRGLTDFDGATTGPALLDLTRVGVSLSLACGLHDWSGSEDDLFSRLLEGYHEGLFAAADASLPPEPSVVRRIREELEANPTRLTDTVAQMMIDVSEDEEAALREALETYVRLQHEQAPELDDRFFEVIRLGRLQLGIGSALDEKFLFRVRGPTDAPDDDVVLEAKEVLSLSAIPCIQASPEPNPFRVLLGQARIAYRPFPYLGFMRAMDTIFWMHGWTNHYHELSVDDAYASVEELRELVYDIGVQLGRGHVNSIATPLDVQLRRAQAEYITRHGAQLRAVIDQLTAATTASWVRFVEQTVDHPALADTEGQTP